MMIKKEHQCVWVVSLGLMALFFLVQLGSAQLIQYWFESGKFSWLNRLTLTTTNQSLPFYLGRIQDVIFGPIEQLLSGGTFFLLAWVFLRLSSFWKFVLAVVVYFVVSRFEVLFFPPYGDAIGGPFAEGLWLARHDFNYLKLLAEPNYADGGARVYMVSIFPTILAVLLKLFPNVDVLWPVCHLLMFFVAAVTVASLRAIGLNVFNQTQALLLSLVLLYSPVFQSQSEAINMEIPSLVFIMLSALKLIEYKIGSSVIMAVLAVLLKGSGVMACGAIVVCLVLLFLLDQQWRFKKRLLFFSAFLLLFSQLNVISKYWLNDQHARVGMMSLFRGWPSFQHFLMFKVFVGMLVVWFIYLVVDRFLSFKKMSWSQWLRHHWVMKVMMVFEVMWFGLFLNFFAVSPRYRVAVYPFFIFSAVYLGALVIRQHTVRLIALSLSCGLLLVSGYGLYDHFGLERSQVVLERSLEYRTDLKLNQKLAQYLQEHYADYTIVAPFTVAQMLGIPQLGYVKKKLDVRIYGFPCYYEGIQNFSGINDLPFLKTIYVTKGDDMEPHEGFPISPLDKVVHELEWGNKKAWFFMGGFGIDQRLKKILFLKHLKKI